MVYIVTSRRSFHGPPRCRCMGCRSYGVYCNLPPLLQRPSVRSDGLLELRQKQLVAVIACVWVHAACFCVGIHACMVIFVRAHLNIPMSSSASCLLVPAQCNALHQTGLTCPTSHCETHGNVRTTYTNKLEIPGRTTLNPMDVVQSKCKPSSDRGPRTPQY